MTQSPADTQSPLEAECKFRVSDIAYVKQNISSAGGEFLRRELHRDTYLRHPSRDFRQTDEALRIREINGEPWVTYKGPRLAGPIKIRPEIELPLAPKTVEQWLQIWTSLGFVIAASVEKEREIYRCTFESRELTVTLDSVTDLGEFAEVERVLDSAEEIQQAQSDILELAKKLGLKEIERKSYLGLLLQKSEAS